MDQASTAPTAQTAAYVTDLLLDCAVECLLLPGDAPVLVVAPAA